MERITARNDGWCDCCLGRRSAGGLIWEADEQTQGWGEDGVGCGEADESEGGKENLSELHGEYVTK